MTKKVKETAMVLADTRTADVLNILDAKIKSLKEITECSYKTGGNLSGFRDIKSETKVENLIRAFSTVKARDQAYHEAAKDMGLKEYPAFIIDGGDVDSWRHDILLRKSVIEYKETLDALTVYKEKMSRFMSEAEQKQMLMEEMGTFLAGLK